MNPIGIICACNTELEPFLPRINGRKTVEKSKHQFYTGTIDGTSVVAVQCGICKVNAALATQIMIEQFQVVAVINSGTAGGMDPRAKILDTVISERVAHHDVGEDILTEAFPYLETEYFPADPDLLEAARSVAKVREVSEDSTNGRCILFGTMVSGESFIDEQGREAINRRFAPLCVDMETAGIAHACYINRVPFLAVRTITDTEEDNGLDIYSKNSHLAGTLAAEITMELIRQL